MPRVTVAQSTFNLRLQALNCSFHTSTHSATVRSAKSEFRRLWIARINAAARQNGLSYSKMMHGLKLAGVDMNRKMLADIAYNDEKTFAALAETAKKALA